jgi:mRNA interferase RelE/StbE
LNLVYLEDFDKDLDKIRNAALQKALARVLRSLESASSLQDIRALKKLRGYRNTYRIRIGEYRLGFYQVGKDIRVARFLHRKDIYRYFPK